MSGEATAECSQCDGYRQQLAEAEVARQKQSVIVGKLKNRLLDTSKLVALYEEKKKSLVEKSARVLELERQLDLERDNAIANRQETGQKLYSKDQELNEMMARCEELTQRLSALEVYRTQMEAHLANLEREADDVAIMRKESHGRDARIRELEGENTRLAAQLVKAKQLREETRLAAKSVPKLKRTLNHAETKVSKLETQLHTAQTRLTKEKQSVEGLKKQASDLKEQVRSGLQREKRTSTTPRAKAAQPAAKPMGPPAVPPQRPHERVDVVTEQHTTDELKRDAMDVSVGESDAGDGTDGDASGEDESRDSSSSEESSGEEEVLPQPEKRRDAVEAKGGKGHSPVSGSVLDIKVTGSKRPRLASNSGKLRPRLGSTGTTRRERSQQESVSDYVQRRLSMWVHTTDSVNSIVEDLCDVTKVESKADLIRGIAQALTHYGDQRAENVSSAAQALPADATTMFAAAMKGRGAGAVSSLAIARRANARLGLDSTTSSDDAGGFSVATDATRSTGHMSVSLASPPVVKSEPSRSSAVGNIPLAERVVGMRVHVSQENPRSSEMHMDDLMIAFMVYVVDQVSVRRPDSRDLSDALVERLSDLLVKPLDPDAPSVFLPDCQAMVLCHAFALLCRKSGDVQRVRVLCIDLVLVRPAIELSLLSTIACTWPVVLRTAADPEDGEIDRHQGGGGDTRDDGDKTSAGCVGQALELAVVFAARMTIMASVLAGHEDAKQVPPRASIDITEVEPVIVEDDEAKVSMHLLSEHVVAQQFFTLQQRTGWKAALCTHRDVSDIAADREMGEFVEQVLDSISKDADEAAEEKRPSVVTRSLLSLQIVAKVMGWAWVDTHILQHPVVALTLAARIGKTRKRTVSPRPAHLRKIVFHLVCMICQALPPGVNASSVTSAPSPSVSSLVIGLAAFLEHPEELDHESQAACAMAFLSVYQLLSPGLLPANVIVDRPPPRNANRPIRRGKKADDIHAQHTDALATVLAWCNALSPELKSIIPRAAQSALSGLTPALPPVDIGDSENPSSTDQGDTKVTGPRRSKRKRS